LSTISGFFGAGKGSNETQELPEVTTRWMFESGVFDGFFFLGPTPADIFKQYTTLTGVTPLPPVSVLPRRSSIYSFLLNI
jgi:alpha-glucosidase (family GH31 glycosyl hydrolase)